jgi:acetyl esterase/lipase
MKRQLLILMMVAAFNIQSSGLVKLNSEYSDRTGNSEVFWDVPYASVSSSQVMDIYIPEGDGPFPVVVLIHGGAFKMGDKRMETRNAEVLVANGYAAVSINYRLSSEAKFPAQVHDCKVAVRFLRANASKYKLNPEKVGSWGASAGGYLSAFLGTTSGIEEFEGSDLGYVEFSSKVIASVDWFGPIDFLTMDDEAQSLGFALNTNSASSPESQLIGHAIQSVPELVKKANSTAYITSDDATFFIQAGSVDRNIPYLQSLNFFDSLKSVLGSEKVYFELLEGAGHGGPLFSSPSNLEKVMAFFDQHLK